MSNDPNDHPDEAANPGNNGLPVIPPLLRSPYPTRSRSRRRQLDHQRMLEEQLTSDPLGLVTRTAGGATAVAPSATGMPETASAINATPEGIHPGVATAVTSRRRRQPHQRPHQQQPPPNQSEMRRLNLFATPGATTAAANPPSHHVSTVVPQSAASHVSIASDYMIGKGLVQARISPMGGVTGTGNNSAKNSRRRRFFPPSRPSPRASTGTNSGGNDVGSGDGSNLASLSAAPDETGTGMAKNSGEGIRESRKDSSGNPEDKIVTEKEKDLILHGMNITRLRKLTLSCLGMGTTGTMGSIGITTQSPKMAVFFAGMVHSKTKSPRDAYVYARALLQNDQPKRTVKWIEQSNLLRCYYAENRDAFDSDTLREEQGNVNNKKTANKLYEQLEELKTLQLESLLLAAQALSELSDWTSVLQLLEDMQHCTFPENHHYHYQQQQHQHQRQAEMNSNNNNMDHDDTENSVHPNHMTIVTTAANSTSVMPPPPPLIPLHLDDDDDIAWQQLAESLRPAKASASSAAITPDRIHTLSRICQLRARAYSELGHPLRANLYWNRALQIDPWCVLALEGLLKTSVQSPASVVESVLMAMSSRSSGEEAATGNDMKDSQNGNDEAEWLRALYLARVCTAAPNTANVPTGGVVAAGNESSNNNNVGGTTKSADSDDPMEDEVDENNDGNGDENMMATLGVTTSFAVPSSHPRTSRRSDGNVNGEGVGVGQHDGNDPSFWQDASSIQLLTPIPQQQSVANMSAAGASLFFPQSAGLGHSHHSSMNHSDHSTVVANATDLSTTAAAAVAVGSALDTLWNKFQLRESPEVLAMAAQNAYRRYDWNAALQYCEELSEMDPLSSNTNKAAFCHVSTLVQLNRKRSLFRLAHEWVETSPKEARSWFAVAAYYYACERYHVAQRHFCRATRLDPHCVEAWIAFGASFAACDESDQALASFRAAQRLAPGNHTSLLYIGMEYLRTNHLVLAQHFLKAANESSGGTDPLVKSETGVLKLNQRKYAHAITWFLMALGGRKAWASTMSKLLATSSLQTTADTNPKYLDALSQLIETIQDAYWEPTLFNLAHAYRKERRFDAAVICLEQCLALKESASAHSALGYCLHLQSIVISTRACAAARKLTLQGRGSQESIKADRNRSNHLLHKAIDSYHQSLAKKPDDPFASEMLQKALSDALEQTDFFMNDDDVAAADTSSVQDSSILNSPPMGQRGNIAGRKVGHHHQLAATTPRSLASLSTTASGMGLAAADQSSMWTEDGLSVSIESNDDVDMT